MADDSPAVSRSRASSLVATLVIVLPLAYMLSVGPAVIAVSKFPSLKEPLTSFYLPLIWLDRNTFMERPLDAYVDFWSSAARSI